MKASVIVFPGSNCDRDVQVSLRHSMGEEPQMVWHGDAEVPDTDLIVLPGGFSYGDYLRCGAIAANSPIMRDVVAKAAQGVPVLGICNGFQILIESGLLPGALLGNAGIHYICRDVSLKVENSATIFTSQYQPGQVLTIPIAHHDGNYFADQDTLNRLEGEGRIAFRYCDSGGKAGPDANPNGSQANIAGILNQSGNVLGMMPHPERLADPFLGGLDGKPMFDGLVEALS